MLSLPDRRLTALCDGIARREAMRIGGLTALGLSSSLLASIQQAAAASPRPGVAANAVPNSSPSATIPRNSGGRAKSVIMLWLLGGPPQHESWDPKPHAPAEVRGEFGVIDSVVPGFHVGELMPKTARLTNHIAALRAVVTKDQAHSSSGYQMLTGVPHIPLSQENVTSKVPNLSPSHAAMMRALQADHDGMPSAISLPHHIANDGEIVWPGQNAGVLGRQYDPWLINCDPSLPQFQIPELSTPEDVSSSRLALRRTLVQQLDEFRHMTDRRSASGRFHEKTSEAFDLIGGSAARQAFALQEESDSTRDRYGRYRFGQSTLLARRLVEAGVSLVQVNWSRVDGGANNGTWDTHRDHCKSLKSFLMPMLDQTYSALIEDLRDRGLLDDTLVVWIGEFGHTPRINSVAGRDHWGNCFSIALAGGGIRGGVVHGESDAHAAFPVSGITTPADITSTIFHCLGYSPETTLLDQTNRPIPLSRGEVIQEILH